ncbi:MAG TPA: hypothetical protein DCM73_08250 [Clostridiales bacterium]|nr:hypothetical protein [Clostridiales bacterium]
MIRVKDIILSLIFRKAGNEMLDLYVALIIAGKRTADDKPNGSGGTILERYRQPAIETLAILGLDMHGNPID